MPLASPGLPTSASCPRAAGVLRLAPVRKALGARRRPDAATGAAGTRPRSCEPSPSARTTRAAARRRARLRGRVGRAAPAAGRRRRRRSSRGRRGRPRRAGARAAAAGDARARRRASATRRSPSALAADAGRCGAGRSWSCDGRRQHDRAARARGRGGGARPRRRAAARARARAARTRRRRAGHARPARSASGAGPPRRRRRPRPRRRRRRRSCRPSCGSAVPGDPLEREADAVAARVVAAPTRARPGRPTSAASAARLMRAPARRPAGPRRDGTAHQPPRDRRPGRAIDRRPAAAAVPLDPRLREPGSSRTSGIDLGSVRVRDGPDADAAAARPGARAFTSGGTIFLAAGASPTDVGADRPRGDPRRPAGRRAPPPGDAQCCARPTAAGHLPSGLSSPTSSPTRSSTASARPVRVDPRLRRCSTQIAGQSTCSPAGRRPVSRERAHRKAAQLRPVRRRRRRPCCTTIDVLGDVFDVVYGGPGREQPDARAARARRRPPPGPSSRSPTASRPTSRSSAGYVDALLARRRALRRRRSPTGSSRIVRARGRRRRRAAARVAADQARLGPGQEGPALRPAARGTPSSATDGRDPRRLPAPDRRGGARSRRWRSAGRCRRPPTGSTRSSRPSPA